MAGDLKVWKGSDVPAEPNLKFERKGGWFVTKVQTALAALFMVILIIAAILLTKYFTEESLKVKDSGAEKISGVLEENIHPISYELTFNHSADKFNGLMQFIFNLENSTSEIILKFKGNLVSSSKLQFSNYSSTYINDLAIESMEYNKEDGTIRIVPSEKLTPGRQYYLTQEFTGSINPEEQGVFKIPYKYPVNGTLEDRYITGALLAPKYCSLVFPCLDNSVERSSFKVKIMKPIGVPTVSNVFEKTIKSVPESPELEMDEFKWSPSLPHSSLSYFILPGYKEKTVEGTGVGISVHYPAHLESTITPISEAASSIMKFYYEFLNTSLPLQRLSVIVIDGLVADHPGTLGVIPISSDLLYSPGQETFKRQERLFYYLGRKLANQWLGNIVSMKSLNDGWLEEGLALYMAHLAASQKFLSYDGSTFFSMVQEKALEEEKFTNTKYFYALPDSSISTNENIYSLYKGAFIFHMLSTIIHPALFREGMQLYTEKWMMNVTEPSDLWECFNTVQDKIDVSMFVNSWNKKGYPVVSVDYENGTITLEQAPVSGDDTSSLWWIPITYTSEDEFDFSHNDVRAWLKEEKNSVINSGLNGSWLILNPHYTGLFRTNYSKAQWIKIGQALQRQSPMFPSTVKAQLLDDSFSLASYGLLDYAIPLNLSLFLQNETEVSPWQTLMKHLNYISLFLEKNSTEHDNFKIYLEKQTNTTISGMINISESKEKEVVKYLQASLVQFSCQHELSNWCNKWVKESFEKWFNEPSMAGNVKILSPELRRTAYCFGNRLYGKNSTQKLLDISRSNIMEPCEEFDILSALACSSDANELNQTLKQTLDVKDHFFSARRTIEVWGSLKEIPSNSLLAFEIVKTEWASILEKFKRESDIIRAILEGSTYALTEETQLDDVKELRNAVEPSSMSNVEAILSNIIEKVDFNVNWRKEHLTANKHWFTNFKNQ